MTPPIYIYRELCDQIKKESTSVKCIKEKKSLMPTIRTIYRARKFTYTFHATFLPYASRHNKIIIILFHIILYSAPNKNMFMVRTERLGIITNVLSFGHLLAKYLPPPLEISL